MQKHEDDFLKQLQYSFDLQSQKLRADNLTLIQFGIWGR